MSAYGNKLLVLCAGPEANSFGLSANDLSNLFHIDSDWLMAK